MNNTFPLQNILHCIFIVTWTRFTAYSYSDIKYWWNYLQDIGLRYAISIEIASNTNKLTIFLSHKISSSMQIIENWEFSEHSDNHKNTKFIKLNIRKTDFLVVCYLYLIPHRFRTNFIY